MSLVLARAPTSLRRRGAPTLPGGTADDLLRTLPGLCQTPVPHEMRLVPCWRHDAYVARRRHSQPICVAVLGERVSLPLHGWLNMRHGHCNELPDNHNSPSHKSTPARTCGPVDMQLHIPSSMPHQTIAHRRPLYVGLRDSNPSIFEFMWNKVLFLWNNFGFESRSAEPAEPPRS